jgi:hypothetical protein
LFIHPILLSIIKFLIKPLHKLLQYFCIGFLFELSDCLFLIISSKVFQTFIFLNSAPVLNAKQIHLVLSDSSEICLFEPNLFLPKYFFYLSLELTCATFENEQTITTFHLLEKYFYFFKINFHLKRHSTYAKQLSSQIYFHLNYINRFNQIIQLIRLINCKPQHFLLNNLIITINLIHYPTNRSTINLSLTYLITTSITLIVAAAQIPLVIIHCINLISLHLKLQHFTMTFFFFSGETLLTKKKIFFFLFFYKILNLFFIYQKIK